MLVLQDIAHDQYSALRSPAALGARFIGFKRVRVVVKEEAQQVPAVYHGSEGGMLELASTFLDVAPTLYTAAAAR